MSNKAENNHPLSVCVLASGSKGNAIFVSGGSTAILVDAGLSGIEIERRMKSKGLSPESLDAILVSHEHADHIRGVGILSRRFGLPVYMNRGTARAGAPYLGKIHDLKPFECGRGFEIDTLTVHPFSVSHDAADPSGFTIKQNGIKIGVATDLGIATAMVKAHLAGCALLILEANHDPDMLIRGPYPWPLKQRIRDRTGHLSNEDSAALLQGIRHDRLRHVILAHLSETNNTPQRALTTVQEAMDHTDVQVSVATQEKGSDLLSL